MSAHFQAYLSIAIALVGLALYLLLKNAKANEIGRIMFFVGLFWTVYSTLGKTVSLGLG